ncbi:MAG: YciI family protein [Chloroflexi bacterium]|nr:YciI family protein [Chloroflexota bacterium]MBV9895518.1 YciI family protein [Chloroflexota bacterium]
MQYMLLITQGEWLETGSQNEQQSVMNTLMGWWGRLAAEGKLKGGAQLQAPATATTVVIDHGKSMLLDRPLMEAKEAIGGYGLVDVADLDEAVAIARSYPVPDCKIEVRAVVER